VLVAIKSIVTFKCGVNIVTDGEEAAINGYYLVFKNVNFYRCLTHFQKNVLHDKIVRFGLIFGKKIDKNEKNIIFIKSLVFVPKDFYKTNLKKLKYYSYKIKI
jgi:hypothetical protein